ncbi:MAG: class I SAM-dependent methyltransferase [Cytophagales bacterium]
MFEFYNQTVAYRKEFYCFKELSELRNEFLKNQSSIEIHDLGAGSVVSSKKNRRISEIAKNSLQGQKSAEFLFKLVNFMQSSVIIELGTSLGLTTQYLAMANTKSRIYTFEGCTQTLEFADSYFKKNNIENITTVLGNINNSLSNFLSKLPSLDLVVFDANHSYHSTLEYFQVCLEKIHNDTVFIFDDIYWSPDMLKAWEQIVQNTHVTISVDFYDFGVVFFRKNQPKQHFILKL